MFSMLCSDNITFGMKTHGMNKTILLDEILKKIFKMRSSYDGIKDEL